MARGRGGRGHSSRSRGIHHHHHHHHRSTGLRRGLLGRHRHNHRHRHFGRRPFGHHFGFGNHHRFRRHYHHYYGTGFGGGFSTRSYGTTYDMIFSNPLPPRIDQGTYFFAGNQQSAVANINNFPTFYQQQCALNNNQPVTINEASFLIVGNKTHQGNSTCYFLTLIFALCLIFPFLFMCCDWWKKRVYQQYEVNVETYKTIVNFLFNTPMINKMTLEVVDNAFNAERVEILHQCLVNRPLAEFTFINSATPLDYSEDEYDNFEANAFPLKELPFTTRLIWDDTMM